MTAFMPEAQTLLMLVHTTLTGSPAPSAACRAGACSHQMPRLAAKANARLKFKFINQSSDAWTHVPGVSLSRATSRKVKEILTISRLTF